VKPHGDALVLELMHFAEELVEPGALQVPRDIEVGARELDMAVQLVERMTGKWDPNKYTDDYRNALLELIQKKVELGGRELPAGPAPKRAPTKVIDLVSVLQESLEQAGRRISRKTSRSPRKQRKTLKRAA
jgi:DNA end-binding protein Ku